MKLLISSITAAAILTATWVTFAQTPGTNSPGQDQRPTNELKDRPEGALGPSTVGSAPAVRSAPGAVSQNAKGALGGSISGRVNPDRAPPPPGGNGPPD
jgi:hypothetical protein